MPGSQISDSICRVLSVIYSADKAKNPTVILLLDAHKAFDCLDWAFLIQTLDFMYMGDKWIKSV